MRGKEGGQGEEVDGGERRRTVSEREEEKGQKMKVEREHKRKGTEREVGNDRVEARRNEQRGRRRRREEGGVMIAA